jgi:RNA polymerase sigma factor (sigma-70 family)
MTTLEFSYQLINLESKLSRFAFRLTSNAEDAKDLLQETMLKAFAHRNKFSDYTNLGAWTFTIMKNTFINNYRRNLKYRVVADTADTTYILNHKSKSNVISPDSVYQAKELNVLIDNLETKFRIPFRMHLEGYKYNEISMKLGLKIGTIKSRIYYARKRIIEILEELN